jgi:hypothetical protein
MYSLYSDSMLCSVSTNIPSLYRELSTTNYVDTEHNIPSQYRELGTANYVDTEHNIPSLYTELGTINYVPSSLYSDGMLCSVST